MIVYNNQEPTNPNNVGQFGATEGSIGAYKQAAEYAADAKYWSLLAEAKFGTVDDLIAEVEKLYQQGILLREDIEALKQDFKDQDARLMQLIAQSNAAVANANNAIALINQKLVEVDKQLDILLGMTVEVTTLNPGQPATGEFDPTTGKISLGIPEGLPGKDGSVKDLNTVDTGVPVAGDLGFYVDQTDNTVHKTTLENIANLIPSVRDISVNGGPAESGSVSLTIDKSTVGLDNVENVASYSKEETNKKVDRFIKAYNTKADADADAINRKPGETILVWEDTKYSFYTVAFDNILEPLKTEPRVVTVNSRIPDSTGNIDITIPTGNPSLYLGEMVMFPYDPTKNISYPGILPADGRLVSKESAADLGPSLLSGQLPVVSETEWQAGAKQYFSWGKQADGITDADSTNYINIRLPDWTGGEAIRSPDSTTDSSYKGQVQTQKPYIVTVNNLAPDDSTGNVNITPATIGAVSTSGDLMNGNLVINLNANVKRINEASQQVNVLSRTASDATSFGDILSNVAVVSKTTPESITPSGTYKFYTEGNKPTPSEIGAAAVTADGVNSDLKTFTQKATFQQPVTIPDAVGDYDAVTYRQLKNQGGGGGGATMNGISNFNIGDFRLIDSRAYIPSNDIPSDGQLLSRTDYPELWAYAQMITPISDADWLADPLKRSQYSLGDGSTTFRVPDKNGVQDGSIKGLFGRGSGDFTQKVHESAAPNITGTFGRLVYASTGSIYETNTGTGAFTPFVPQAKYKRMSDVATLEGSGPSYPSGYEFAASNSSPVYGRLNVSEIRPNSFVGVWVIRAKGAFIAANTSWSVINSDEVKPVDGTTVSGGNIISDYQIDGVSEGTANLRFAGTLGAGYSARLSIANRTSGGFANFDFNENGRVETPAGRLLAKDDYGIGARATIRPTSETTQFMMDSVGDSSLNLWSPANGGGIQMSYNPDRIVQLWIEQGSANLYTRPLTVSNPQTPRSAVAWGQFQKAGTSDANFKDIGDDLDLTVPLNNIKALEFKNFTYKSDESKSPRRGVIAQQAEQVDPQYVHSAEFSGVMTLDSNPLLLDALAAIKCLSEKVEELEAKLAAK